jgi:hypothetical protein
MEPVETDVKTLLDRASGKKNLYLLTNDSFFIPS